MSSNTQIDAANVLAQTVQKSTQRVQTGPQRVTKKLTMHDDFKGNHPPITSFTRRNYLNVW